MEFVKCSQCLSGVAFFQWRSIYPSKFDNKHLLDEAIIGRLKTLYVHGVGHEITKDNQPDPNYICDFRFFDKFESLFN